MKVSFITTVLNEEKTIKEFLDSLLEQTKIPDEVIIVDGGSTDKTVEKIELFKKTYPALMIYIIKAKGANRARGRNEAIKKASGEIIVSSDAGCELDKRWLEKITGPWTLQTPPPSSPQSVDVVAGYYRAKPKSIFEKCVVPYVLVMPDKVNPQQFLPASRSMAIKKSIWQKFGGFPEEFSDNEDYVLANKLKNGGAKIVFCREAIVFWYPRSNLKDFFVMIYRFARGDAQAGLRDKKVALIFGRCAIGAVFLIAAFLYPILIYRLLILLGIVGYLGWAIGKNYRYVKHPLAFIYLPLIQLTADLAVMAGTVKGRIKRSEWYNYRGLWDF